MWGSPSWRLIAVWYGAWIRGRCFLCGRVDLDRGPRHDLMQLVWDTRPLYGTLEGLHEFTPDDVDMAIQIGDSALYHSAVNCFLYDNDPSTALPALEKSAFPTYRLFLICLISLFLPYAHAEDGARI